VPALLLHFIDEKLGLCSLRVPTWCPFRLQFYCNGHAWLARKLSAVGIDFALADNAFVRLAECDRSSCSSIPSEARSGTFAGSPYPDFAD
jgi:hypothetical protein